MQATRRVARCELLAAALAPRRHGRASPGRAHDRRERAVDVAQDAPSARALAQRSEQLARQWPVRGRRRHAALVSPTMSGPRVSRKLAVIGTAAGAFSGLFGVGGGTVIVPLLILWFAYGEHEATGTSLAAIVVIALLGAIVAGRLRQRRPRQGPAGRGPGGRRGGRRHVASAAALGPQPSR